MLVFVCEIEFRPNHGNVQLVVDPERMAKKLLINEARISLERNAWANLSFFNETNHLD